MTTAIPALSSTYSSRGNVPFGTNNTTTLLLHQFFIWALRGALLNDLSTGTTGGSGRTGSNTATVLGSSDGATAGLDGVDRWTSTFTPSKIVRATSGTAHSWIALRIGGYDIVLDVNSVSDGFYGFRAVKSSVGLAGGSTTACPISAGASNSEEFVLGSVSVATTSSAGIFNDVTLNQATYFHFSINADGTRWWVGKSRISQGVLDGWAAFWPAVNGRAADTRNQWWLRGGATSAGRGSPTLTTLGAASGTMRRGYANAAPVSNGAFGAKTFGGTTISGLGADLDTTDYLTFPAEMCLPTSPPLWCGTLPDIYLITGGTVGSQPSGDTSRVILGDLIVPGYVQPIV